MTAKRIYALSANRRNCEDVHSDFHWHGASLTATNTEEMILIVREHINTKGTNMKIIYGVRFGFGLAEPFAVGAPS
jgi:hypothetical protein